MHHFPINATPLMTKHLVQETSVFREAPIVLVDIGARSGFPAEWKVFEDQCRLYCFEPNEEECNRLAAAGPSHVTYIPTAIAGVTSTRTMYEANLPYSTGLFKGNMDFYGRFLGRDNLRVIGEHDIKVRALDEVMRTYDVSSIDFMKIDVEGAELEILQQTAFCSPMSSLLGILTEIRFHEESNGSPPFAEVDGFLSSQNFRLFNLQFNNQTRHVLPYPGMEDYRLSTGERFYAYSRNGQILDGDALYFRDLFLPAGRVVSECLTPSGLLKLCALYEIYSLNDCAAEVILANRARLISLVDCDRILDLLASGILGQRVKYRDYLAAFSASPTLEDFRNAPRDVISDMQNAARSVSKLGRTLARFVSRRLRTRVANRSL